MIRRSIDFASLGSGFWSENRNISYWNPFVAQGGWAAAWSQHFPKSYSLTGSWARSGAWVKNRNDSWHWRDNS